MFILLASYKVEVKHQKQFLKESKAFYVKKFKSAKGFKEVKFLRNIQQPGYIDVLTSWKTKEDFFNFIKAHQKQGTLKYSIPVEVLERYLYEELKE